MSTTPYNIDFGAPQGKINRDLDAYDARLAKTDANIDKVIAKLKGLGSDTSGLKVAMAALVALDAELKSKVTDANAATKALQGVGKGNSAVTSLTKRLKDLEAQITAIQAAAASATPGLAGLGSGGPKGGGGGGGGGKTGFGAAMAFGLARNVAARAIHKAGSAVVEAGSEARSFFGDAADEAKELREKLRDVANLDGKPEVNESVIRQHLEFQRATGLNSDEAHDLRLEFGGAIAPGKARGNITDETATELEKESAKFGLRYDLDMTTTGRMAGHLANYGKVPSAAHGVGVLAESAEQLNLYGVGPVKGMMAPMLGLAGSMLDEEGGRFRSFESMSARMAATTVSTAGKAAVAANQMRQANRALRKLDPETKEGKFNLKAGVTARDTYEQALAKVAPFIAGPEGDQVLLKAGFGNEREREGLIKQTRMTPVVEAQLKDPRMAQAKTEAIARNTAFGNTLIGKEREAANAQERSRIENGMLGERLRAGREAATGRLSDPNQPGGNQLKAGFFGSILDMGPAFFAAAHGRTASGEQIRVDNEAIAGLIEGGRKVGVDIPKQFPSLDWSRNASHPLAPEDMARQYSAAFDAVSRAGGDPYGGSPQELGKKLREAADAADKFGKGGPRERSGLGGGDGFVPGRR